MSKTERDFYVVTKGMEGLSSMKLIIESLIMSTDVGKRIKLEEIPATSLLISSTIINNCFLSNLLLEDNSHVVLRIFNNYFEILNEELVINQKVLTEKLLFEFKSIFPRLIKEKDMSIKNMKEKITLLELGGL